MSYKHLFIFFLILSCVPNENVTNYKFKKSFSNSGFAFVYDDKNLEKNYVSKKLDSRSLIIYQRNLKPKTNVKVTNLLNNKSIIATVGAKVKYPLFYNSVISKRIADEIKLNLKEPYVRIYEINSNSTFVANKSVTFEEEREVAQKAPVTEIGIMDLTKQTNTKKKIVNNSNFEYIIKIADFYYLKSAKNLKKKMKIEFNIRDININEMSKTKYRIYLGPYKNIHSLKENYNKILSLEFENIEIIKL